jgi:signal peptidase I
MGGDTVEVRSGVVSVTGAEIPPAEVKNDPNPCPTEIGEPGCWFARETSGARTYTIMFDEHPAQDHPRTVIPPGEVFVLGDNRNNSYDSRRWGTVPVDHIKGVVTMTWWSRGLGVTDVRWSRVGSAIH